MTTVNGIVINIHHHGATVRLEDGTLAAVPAAELAANRPAYVQSWERRRTLALALDGADRHRIVTLPHAERTVAGAPPPTTDPLGTDEKFEAHIGAYLKATLEWAPADRPPPAERHFIRKMRRARLFEARTDNA